MILNRLTLAALTRSRSTPTTTATKYANAYESFLADHDPAALELYRALQKIAERSAEIVSGPELAARTRA
jgi:hypothetical protein